MNQRQHNPDWIERQKPCYTCGQPIGDEAMVTDSAHRWHARCIKQEQDCHIEAIEALEQLEAAQANNQ